MKFDIFQSGVMNWCYLDIEEMDLSASQKHLEYNKGRLQLEPECMRTSQQLHVHELNCLY